ncbi:MAG: hypothetical protein QOF58_6643 [Pseudonocardiales bacterium]|jgi:hypothetical protein|nr:hypothetical protein [Actinomycetota bacterium]MDT7788224.1 hypothetical protein [Pseudonocardiales bacterium]
MTSRRQRARAQREAEFWGARLAACRTASARVAVVFDRLRARISRQPATAREQAWAEVESAIDALISGFPIRGED